MYSSTVGAELKLYLGASADESVERVGKWYEECELDLERH